jgi:hypothetical protein
MRKGHPTAARDHPRPLGEVSHERATLLLGEVLLEAKGLIGCKLRYAWAAHMRVFMVP